ncbi:cytochrome c3 family protein [Aureibacter tunicatorum]|uniref:Mono/diheme cytochrome c family protein n=1 Tax=Aureibacter tunicatorum TaxID=866807 RepID=A0AAE4BSM5_9BACT|nr:cytochrome c3 family protein [Aureibacter tunicatorum]MDR6238978.1 mono/diheme cytochrome c family protein [Aureibacter tunicatorum]BDD05096.1 cytochrome c [Aureibacter tunicatorum]
MLKKLSMMSFRKMIARSSLAVTLICALTLVTGVFASAKAESSIPTDDAKISAGKSLFENNCTVCHAVHEQVVGPALKDVTERRSVAWLQAFIGNSQKVIKSGDKTAVKLYEEFGKTEMPSFDFSEEEILSVLAYVKQESTVTPTPGGEDVVVDGLPVPQQPTTSSEYVQVILLINVAILVLILVVLALIINVLTKYLNGKEGLSEEDREIVNQKFSLKSLFTSKPAIFFATLIFVAVVGKTVIDGLFLIGVQQGYAPTQPIAFSHKIHAGQYEIDCNYCHTGVTKSKNANIPSANICMNCHSQVKTDSKEIQKIYAAVENNKPIEWVRIHNLPDLAYFNHSQHVKVGGVECQTCHGPIEEMAVVRQHSNLTMGWCINCHRETKVNAEGNAYYDKLLEAHGSSKSMTVSDIGGLECSKCHY